MWIVQIVTEHMKSGQRYYNSWPFNDENSARAFYYNQPAHPYSHHSHLESKEKLISITLYDPKYNRVITKQ